MIILWPLRNEIIWVDMFEKAHGRLGGIDEFGGSFVVVLLRFDVPIVVCSVVVPLVGFIRHQIGKLYWNVSVIVLLSVILHFSLTFYLSEKQSKV